MLLNSVPLNNLNLEALLIIDNNASKFRLFSGTEFLELPWEFVKKIGSSTIIVDIEENEMRRISR